MERIRQWVIRFSALAAIVLAVFTVHELGHFVCAKAFDVRVIGFEIGKGPKLVAFQIGETEFSLAPIPIGAETVLFVDRLDTTKFTESQRQLFLANPAAVRALREKNAALAFDLENLDRSFSRIETWERVVTILAGPFFNILFAIVITLVACFVPPQQAGAGGKLRPFITDEPDDSFIDALSLPLHFFCRKVKVDELTGPLGIFEEVWRMCGSGLRAFLVALSSTSIALAYANLLPIPTLDGGWLALMFWDLLIQPLSPL